MNPVRSVLSWLFSSGDPANPAQRIAHQMHAEHAIRLRRYERNWRFYRGNQWTHIRTEDDPVVTTNLIRYVVDSSVDFMFSKTWKTTIPDNPSTKEQEPDTRKFILDKLDEQWNRNDTLLLGVEMGQTAAVTGDAFLRVSWDDSDPYAAGFVRVDAVPPNYVFPFFGGPAGVDKKDLQAIVLVFPRYTNKTMPLANRMSDTSTSVTYYAEEWTKDTVTYYEDGQNPVVKPNPLGCIPVVHVPNFPSAGDFFGQSDVDDLIPLQQTINEKLTDVSDTISYYGSPVTILLNARIADLERGADKVWALPKDSDAKNLEMKGDLTAAVKYLEILEKQFVVLSRVSPTYFSTTLPGNLSGAAIDMLYTSMVNRFHTKSRAFSRGLQAVNRIMLKILELKDQEFYDKMRALPQIGRYDTAVTFSSPKPRDEAQENKTSRELIEMQLTSRRQEMKKRGFTDSQIEDIFKEINDDYQEQAALEMKYGVSYEDAVLLNGKGKGNDWPALHDVDERGTSKSEMAAERSSTNETAAKKPKE